MGVRPCPTIFEAHVWLTCLSETGKDSSLRARNDSLLATEFRTFRAVGAMCYRIPS